MPRNLIIDETKTTALYERLSRDDGTDSESNSITNQKLYLEKSAKSLNLPNIEHYTDDGFSGLNTNRPSYQRLMKDILSGKIGTVVVKDLSRLGRDYVNNGWLIETFFAEHDVRFIALMDGVDTFSSNSLDHYAYINVTNQQMAMATSRRLKLTNEIKGNEGKPLGPPPYGYIKNPANPKFWIIDEAAAKVVRDIFSMYRSGLGTYEIANILNDKKVLTPTLYWESIGKPRASKYDPTKAALWKAQTINTILKRQEYCGDVINFKTYSKTPKNKKRYKNSAENIKIFHDVHEPVIDRETFNIVQRRLDGNRHRKSADKKVNIFNGLLVCADCGGNLNYHFNQGNPDLKYFNCANNNNNRGCTGTHYIRMDFLEKIVMAELKALMSFARENEEKFARFLSKCVNEEIAGNTQLLEGEIRQLNKRNIEINRLYQKIYEDNALGKITDTRFQMLSKSYDEEQLEVQTKLKEKQLELDRIKEKESDIEKFMAAVRKYTRVTKLTAKMLNELIDKIVVYQSEIIDGIWVQKIDIYYRCIGFVTSKEENKKVIENKKRYVEMEPRQGVVIANKKRE